LLHPQYLSDAELKRVIVAALNNDDGAKFTYNPEELLPKLEKHGVSIQDLIHVCRNWVWVRERKWDSSTWRYVVEGENLDGRWMRVVIATYTNPINVIAVTGFNYSRGRKQKP